ncbi:carboxylate--amine ligase [Actinomadura parmotrematis]|uniref:ATP-grasp domain-containing protein n=1 Tax=Actinomadura parmotrematis TaxID=2864039 RepID=A0ABS7FXN5_9ACTN|nr:ATP-grasp domain-containing protein [Actinomadura parmotrematis]MBW8484740.1 ATP-grasp domain-containing protein [Actinomadura parmotrematis]
MGRQKRAGEFPALDRGLPALILRTHRYPLHHGTLGAVRSLGRAGVEVHAVLEERGNPAARSRHLHRALPWGPPPGEAEPVIDHLRGLAARIGRPALLVTVDDAGALFAARHAARLREWFVLPDVPADVPARVADKARLAELCAELGIAHPPTAVPAGPAGVDAAAGRFGLPLMAKWARPWHLPPGFRSAELVATAERAHELYAASRAPGQADAGPLILQELVGHRGGDWFFQGYFDESSACLFGGAGRKHLARPVHAGHTVTGEWVANPELEDLARAIVKAAGYSGAVDMDFRETADRTYHLVDFNPRLGAQFRLFHDARGLDIVRAQHLHLSGRPVPPARPDYGRTLVVEDQCLHHALAHPTGLPAALRSLAGAGERAWYARDDRVPLAVVGAHGFGRAARGAARRAARPLRRPS